MPQFKAAFESTPNGLLIVDGNGLIVVVNHEVERLFDYPRQELQGQPVEILIPDRYIGGHPLLRSTFCKQPKPRAMGHGRDLYAIRKDGAEFPVEIGLTPVETDEGLQVICSIVDISDRKRAELEQSRLEDQLRQSQKIEAIGQLSGGIAHDFNNILQAILGHAEIMRDGIKDTGLRCDINNIVTNVKRGKSIVERILIFSRNEELTLQPMDIKQELTQACQFLRSTLPSNIDIAFRSEPGMPRVKADRTSVEQILFNLVNNAVAAMGNGGKLDVALEPFYAHDSFIRMHPDLHEGWYVNMMVRDSGVGMDEETRERAFEPFYTTKAPGIGSGLGLSVVHGLMSKHGGTGWIDSMPGSGTAVSCLFPSVEFEEVNYISDDISVPYGNCQKILCIEDEASLQTVNERILRTLGYKPYICIDPRTALDMFRASPEQYDLAMIDYSMPNLNGIQLGREILNIRPGIPVILVSGAVNDSIEEKASDTGIDTLLRKPFTRLELAHTLYSILNNRR